MTVVFPARRPPLRLPSYSLTGDLLGYLRCPYQYRLFSRPGVRESHPVQRWYGQFLHRGMRIAYQAWTDGTEPAAFSWRSPLEAPFSDLVNEVTRSLKAEGLYRPASMGEVAEKRLLRAIRILGPLLFPLIKEAEVRVAAVRDLSDFVYEARGVVDVLAAGDLSGLKDNALVARVGSEASELVADPGSPAEIVVDYRGITKREADEAMLEAARKQVLTYAWLRNRRVGADVVIGGVLAYVNDLLTNEDEPDSDPGAAELAELLQISTEVIVATPKAIDDAVKFFDQNVRRIETCVDAEGSAPLAELWVPSPERQTCAACDARYRCPKSDVKGAPQTRPFSPSAP
jgi:PD-(D/E)XK nuclease superfamily